MFIFKTVKSIQNHLNKKQTRQKKIGFVPTMGALHEGHLSLLKQSLKENDLTVVSIFVNPTQFGDPEDLEKYPKPIESDIEKLEKYGCDLLFLPETKEVYPHNRVKKEINLRGLDKTMEGAHRPNHFAGVVGVVDRLLEIVQPDRLYMGQKDYQQFAIIKQFLRRTKSKTELIRIPIVREADGLAMSSRNIRLSDAGRKKAVIISQTLYQAREDSKTMTLTEVKQKALSHLKSNGMDVDYFEIADGDNLQSITTSEQSDTVIICTTVRIDGIRLLDNIIIKESH